MVDQGNRTGPVPSGGFDYDLELSRYQLRLRDAIDVGPDDRVLDIGCGAGQTTREAARLAIRGSALGVDTSSTMVAQARQLSAAEELHNVRFQQADAQTYPFPPDHFTLGFSRFGTMFFADPVEAFTNIGRALAPGARLVQLAWQDSGRQEWMTAIHRALTGADPPSAPAAGPDPFSLADPATVESILTAAGFTDINITDVREPICYGPDPDAAVNAILKLHLANDNLAKLNANETEPAVARLHSIMAAHTTPNGVWFNSRTWLITAHH